MFKRSKSVKVSVYKFDLEIAENDKFLQEYFKKRQNLSKDEVTFQYHIERKIRRGAIKKSDNKSKPDFKLQTYKKLLKIEHVKKAEKNYQLVQKMPEQKCILWLQYSIDWLRKQITHRNWAIPEGDTYDSFELYCQLLGSKVWKLLLDELQCVQHLNTRPYMSGVYNLYDELQAKEPRRSFLARIFGRREVNPGDTRKSSMFTQQFSEQLLYEIKISLQIPNHPIVLMVKKFQQIILDQIREFNRKINFVEKLARHDAQIEQHLSKKQQVDNEEENFTPPEILKRSKTTIQANNKFKIKMMSSHRTYSIKAISREEQFNIIQIYSQNVIDICQRLISPFLYTSLEYFYCPCIDVFELKSIKENLIIELTNLIVKDQLAKYIIQLSRFQFLSQELELAQKCNKMFLKDLGQIGVDELFRLPQKQDPYRESVEILQYLNEEKSPIEKMKMMVQMTQKIVSEIESYYIDQEDKSNLVIDADQLLMILIYVLVKSQVKMVSLYAHISQIYEFSTDQQKLSIFGHSVTNLEVCLESILNDQQYLSSKEEDEGFFSMPSDYQLI